MTETTTGDWDPAPKYPRVKHRTVHWGGGTATHEGLTEACRDLEERGYMLTGLVQVDEWTAVAVFVGAESFVIPSSVEVALEAPEPGPSEIVLEPEGLDKP